MVLFKYEEKGIPRKFFAKVCVYNLLWNCHGTVYVTVYMKRSELAEAKII